MASSSGMAFLERLLKSSGPSGFETRPAAVFREYLKPFAESVRTDVTGNTIACLNGAAPFKVMLAGHYDEIGFQVVHISDEGLVYFREVGGIDKLTVPGMEVEIMSSSTGEKMPGVIGRKPIHLQTPKEREAVPELKEMWIDIGAESRKEAAKRVSVGDPVAMKVNFEMFGAHRVKSKGLDDKIGAFVIAEAFRKLSSRKLKVGVYAVGTVQEELGLRGAHTSAFGISPDVGICVDVGFATDVPGVEKRHYGDVTLGGGPALSRNADNNPVLFERMVKLAKKGKIKYQLKCGFRASGGTDTSVVQLTRSGVATSLISIPNRYMHTPVEICDMRDVQGAIDLIVETVASFKGTESFIPGID